MNALRKEDTLSIPVRRLSFFRRRPERPLDIPEAIGATDAELVRLTGDPIAREYAGWEMLRLLHGPRLA